jgi:hypothetical protein
MASLAELAIVIVVSCHQGQCVLFVLQKSSIEAESILCREVLFAVHPTGVAAPDRG